MEEEFSEKMCLLQEISDLEEEGKRIAEAHRISRKEAMQRARKVPGQEAVDDCLEQMRKGVFQG